MKKKGFGWKIMVQVALLLGGGTPVWLVLLAKWLLEPEGFWQKVVIFGIGGYFLAGIQLVLVVIVIILSIDLWET